MSMCLCEDCGAFIDSDDDPDCFVEVGNMRRMTWTKIYCESCRDNLGLEQDRREWEMNTDGSEATK